ncbi:4-amino-4-deoxy-L-arabinose transferase-like protein [Chloroflexus aggregans DSM 9485]|uniref:4-amino-4-deoxy-L-arabinose transferase-like protein n=2 Tax=Chloroflexus aggregans TaxID=152260 RepID=B8G5N3_CHLAD|nr:4-amino-4-deoxy-L-arabinose transferase-like protein [Chloroflexus aggregans DSM 9485]
MNKLLATQTRRSSIVSLRTGERIAALILMMLIVLLALVNLPYAPRTWFDEGSHLHVPETLVRYGVYADISSEGYRYFGPTIGVGPTVMLPIALVFAGVGVDLLPARLVIVMYLFVALWFFYRLAAHLHGTKIALLTVVLLIASRTRGFEGMVEYGRQVLGEVPGVAWLGAGLLAYTLAIVSPNQRRRYALLAGVGFGLALITKNQFALIIAPGLGLLALLDWGYFRVGDWWLRLAPPMIAGAMFVGWLLIMLAFLGPADFSANLAKTRQAAGGAIFVFEIAASMRSVRYLVQVYGGLLIPALLYSLWRCRRGGAPAFAELTPTLLAVLWLGWYLISLGWPRYAFPAVVLGAPAVARMIGDVTGWLWQRGHRWLAGTVAAYVVLVIGFALSLTIQVITTPDDSTHRMAAFLNQTIPTDTIIETWEPELAVLTDHTYHYVPTELLDSAVRHAWLGGPPVAYDGLAAQPPYVLTGPFSTYTGIYSADVLTVTYTPLYSVGPYTLWQRNMP